MRLTEELLQAARTFGEALRSTEAVQAYLTAEARLRVDAEADDLDRRRQDTYQDLATRQRAGEQLPRHEVDAFHALHRQAQDHPLIAEWDIALTGVKTVFVNIGQELSQALGIDYTALALEK